MRVFQYDPWRLLEQFRNEVNTSPAARASSAANGHMGAGDWVPPVDIMENDSGYVLLADLPGVDPGGIEIHVENGVLALRGERSVNTSDRDHYKRVERPRGVFYRRFNVPDAAEADRITAKFRNGVIEITIPKQQKPQPRKITVEG